MVDSHIGGLINSHRKSPLPNLYSGKDRPNKLCLYKLYIQTSKKQIK